MSLTEAQRQHMTDLSEGPAEWAGDKVDPKKIPDDALMQLLKGAYADFAKASKHHIGYPANTKTTQARYSRYKKEADRRKLKINMADLHRAARTEGTQMSALEDLLERTHSPGAFSQWKHEDTDELDESRAARELTSSIFKHLRAAEDELKGAASHTWKDVFGPTASKSIAEALTSVRKAQKLMLRAGDANPSGR